MERASLDHDGDDDALDVFCSYTHGAIGRSLIVDCAPVRADRVYLFSTKEKKSGK